MRFLVLTFALPIGLAVAACQPAPAPSSTAGQAIEGIEYDHFPAREAIDTALANFQADQAGARAHDPVPLNEFFGERVNGAFSSDYKVEFLKPDPRVSPEPIAALHVKFHPTDALNINNRYKDLYVFHLADSLGAPFNPFPEVAAVPGETGIVMRLWTGFQKISKGVPADMEADQVLPDLARISIWSYLVGNTDGVSNGGNAGFAKFRDASGREFWHAVLVDAGGAFNHPGDNLAPWNLHLAGRGTVDAANIPQDVVDTLRQIANASDADIVTYSGVTDPVLSQAVVGIRGRAGAVLDHYMISRQ